jgi:hypothetical protein
MLRQITRLVGSLCWLASSRQQHALRSSAALRFRPTLEGLEDRTVPSVTDPFGRTALLASPSLTSTGASVAIALVQTSNPSVVAAAAEEDPTARLNELSDDIRHYRE